MGRLNIYSNNYNGATVISNRFFDEYMKSGTYFERKGNVTESPDIDFSTLE